MLIHCSVQTGAAIIKSMYELANDIHTQLIPPLVYYNIARELDKSEDDFMIDCFDFWVKNHLKIAPLEALDEKWVEECKEHGFYCETKVNNTLFIAVAEDL